MIHFSDRAIVEGLKLNSDFIIKHVYQEFFPTIRYLIKKNTGNDEDAEDIFQESLIVILKNVQKEDFYRVRNMRASGFGRSSPNMCMSSMLINASKCLPMPSAPSTRCA